MQIQTFDYSVDLLKSILWQYNDAEKLLALMRSKQNWYEQAHTQFWQDWYNNVFNLQTANEFGLSVWSIILNLPLFNIDFDPTGAPIFGFDDPFYKNFDNGVFGINLSPIDALTIEEKRLVLKLRYYQLISNGTVPAYNEFLNFCFQGFGKVYCIDNLDMTMTYFFEFHPSDNLLAVLKKYDLLMRPSTVGIKYVDLTIPIFGFDDPFYKNFDNGIFYEGS